MVPSGRSVANLFAGARERRSGDVVIYQNGGTGFVARSEIESGAELIDKWKIYVGRAAPGTGNKDTYPHRILSTPFVGEPGISARDLFVHRAVRDESAGRKRAHTSPVV